MAYWYYTGRVTTPINVPGKGPIVLRPRERFHAPPSAVAHLLRLDPPLVKRLPDPPPSVEPEQAKQEAVPAAAETKSERPTMSAQSQPVPAGDVVSAALVEAGRAMAVIESASDSVEEVNEGEDTSSVSEESESRPRRRRRPDR